MNVSAPFIHRPVMTTLVMLALMLAGFFSFFKLPVSDLPTIERPKIEVNAYYTGADAETMVKLVTKPLEKELISVSGVREVSSQTSRGSTYISLDFALDKNLDEAAREVQTALNRAQDNLPTDMEQNPYYNKQAASHEHILYLIMTSKTASVAEMRQFSDIYIEPRLARIEGVAHVDSFGSPYAIKIQLNPEILAARGLTLEDVTSAIRQQNADYPLGVIKTGTRQLSIEMPGNRKKAHDFAHLIIAEGPVFLKDVATLKDSEESENEFHYLTKESTELALIFGITKIAGANTVAISKEVNKLLPDIQKDLPITMQLQLWFDKAVWINESILDVEWSMLFAFVLVVLVIFFSLGRLSDALVPSLALPTSIIGTLAAMYFLHFSLDILSLLALTLSLGFVVDDAIVMLENIVRYQEKGETAYQASLKGSKEICFTICSMTLSLVAVFIPVLFMDGLNGRLFHEFSVTMAVAIIISGFISLTLTPALCSKVLKPKNLSAENRKSTKSMAASFSRFYGKSLLWCLHHPKSMVLIALACLAAIYPLFKQLPVELFPQEDRGLVISIVNLPKGISKEAAAVFQKKIESRIRQHPHVENLLDLSWQSKQIYLSRLVPHRQRPPQAEIIQQIQKEIDSIPGTQAFTIGWQLINLDLDLGHGGNFKYRIRGFNSDEVDNSARALMLKMQTMPEFAFVKSDAQQNQPKLVVSINEDQASKYGIAKGDVQSVLQNAFAQGSVTKVSHATSQHKVYAELAPDYQNSPAALAKLTIKNKEGDLIPLKSIATWKESMGSSSIQRIDQLPTATLHFSVNPAVPANQAMAALEKAASEILPESLTGRLDGAAAAVQSTLGDTLLLIGASTLVMYLVLGILYESFIHPLTILSTLPLAALGGLLTLVAFNQPLSLFSIMGFLLLIGIVKKNGIMIVDFALDARKQTNVSAEQAIYQGCMVRFRPIMMTTFAAVMGAVPIAIGFGDSSEARRGLGLVIVGGLVFSQMLTLYVTPTIYLILEKFKDKAFRTATGIGEKDEGLIKAVY